MSGVEENTNQEAADCATKEVTPSGGAVTSVAACSHVKPVSAPNPAKAVPDGGYGWVVVFGAALTHFLLVGMARSLGVLYLILLDRYGRSATATAWVLSAFNATRTLAGPISSKLVDSFEARRVAIAGSLVLCLGLVASAFAMNLWYLYATFGVLTGMGGAMVFVPAYIMVGKYFDKHKGKAMAFATIGSGLGNVFFAPAISVLFDFYSYFGALVILGACQLHNAVSGSLYRPLQPVQTVHPLDKELHKIDSSHLKEKGTVDEKKRLTGYSADACDKSNIKTTALKPECKNLDDDAFSQRGQTDGGVPSGCCAKTSLARNVTFYMYGYLVMSMQTCIMTFLIFLPDLCREMGKDTSTAAWVLTIFGLSDMVGRFLFGFLFDLKPIRRKRRDFYCFVSGMFGLCVMATSLMPNFTTVCVITGITAIFEGATHSQRATVLSELVLPAQMSTAVGVIIFCQGVGNLYGPPLAGMFKDMTGTSRYGFVYCGTLMLTASLLFLAEGFLCKRCREERWRHVESH